MPNTYCSHLCGCTYCQEGCDSLACQTYIANKTTYTNGEEEVEWDD